MMLYRRELLRQNLYTLRIFLPLAEEVVGMKKMSRKKILLKEFREGTILWIKSTLIIAIVVATSYLLSKIFFPFGFFYYIYIYIFSMPGAFLQVMFLLGKYSSIFISFTILPIYLFISLNYFYLYFKKKKTVWWLTTLFVITTILYVVGIILGWLTFLVWHP